MRSHVADPDKVLHTPTAATGELRTGRRSAFRVPAAGDFHFSCTLGIPTPPPGAPAFVIYVPVVVVVGTFSLTNRRQSPS